ncbi:penicillin-binding transpeptidase domain-containing protein [Carnobacterium gallinarum]|uniref:penicillin-binding transpeptidase domain-containing protein n=1 Tax=Carnobacterium gallinarum TaxID=2749 RepID=UPI000690079A|nr:penicillin-binding transpeptidase domain-containing protein [Carnobacterium gallinarum]
MSEGKANNAIKKKKSHIPFRLNLLFFLVFFLFATLILRLGVLQLVKGEQFEAEVQRTEKTYITGNVPRGMIYDSQGRELVGNKAMQAITYTRSTQVSAVEMMKTAKVLSQYIQMTPESIADLENNPRDLQDYWAIIHEKELNKRLKKKEKKLEGAKLYDVQLSKIKPEEWQGLTSAEKQVAAIFKRMNGTYALTTTFIKSKDVLDTEIAAVSENLTELPGVDTSTDWQRIYPQEDMLKSILGSVTTEKVGLPEDQASALMAKGYARNDRVGNSYIEKQYETVLSGSKSQSETEVDANGQASDSITTYSGAKGDNLVLTINIDFQNEVEEIVKNAVSSTHASYYMADRIYVVVSNPHNGEILALVGKRYNYETDEIEDDALGTMNSQYTMGSSVKGATVLAGYMDGVITLNNSAILEQPLKFRGTESKSSYFNRAGGENQVMNDITALEVSSNSYMMQIAMRMGGQYTYTPNGNLEIDKNEVFSKLRNYYRQFGLGVETGIDLPGESTGGRPPIESSIAGLALDFSFGQFDTYTPLQLNQYISTVANGGQRIAPHVVKEVRGTDENGQLGAIKYVVEPNLLNNINVGQEEINNVKKGMYNVIYGNHKYGTGRKLKEDLVTTMAAKTGTAEAFYGGGAASYPQGTLVTNLTLVGYAPADNPEIALSVVVPYLGNDKTSVNQAVAKEVVNAYFNMKK